MPMLTFVAPQSTADFIVAYITLVIFGALMLLATADRDWARECPLNSRC